MDAELEQLLAAIGPRLRSLRRDRGMTLQALSAATGISVSGPVEILHIFGPHGDQARVRARPAALRHHRAG